MSEDTAIIPAVEPRVGHPTVEPSPGRGPRLAPPAPPRERWGEELPIFCERCGYSLNGLAQNRCSSCTILHFSCPECGHHQPINTLRPAFQRVLGRLRAQGLALIVLIKINFFFWSLLGWGAFGMELAQQEIYSNYWRNGLRGQHEFQNAIGFVMFIFAVLFSAIGRMLLLRWRRGAVVGLVIGGLMVLAITIGAHLQRVQYTPPKSSPLTGLFIQYLLCAMVGGVVGGGCVWGIWMALVHAFLPRRTASALIEWQRALSMRSSDRIRAEPALSVTT